jgi:hypothetical protein
VVAAGDPALPHCRHLHGGGTWLAWQADEGAVVYGGGLVGVLVLIAVIALLFTGRSPGGIFDLVLGMNR